MALKFMGAAKETFHGLDDAWGRVITVFILQRRKLRHKVCSLLLEVRISGISGISGMFGADLRAVPHSLCWTGC